MESNKKFGLLRFDKKLTIFIKEIASEEEVFNDLKTIESMKSFVNLSLSQLNVTKIATDKFRVDIQILIEEKDSELAINLLKSKNFRQISEIKIVQSKENSKTNSHNKDQQIIYTEKYHFAGKQNHLKDLYDEIKTRITDEFDDIEVIPHKICLNFNHDEKNIMAIEPMKTLLTVWFNLNKGQLNDYLNRTRDVSTVGHHGNGDYEMKVYDFQDIDYLIELFKQCYKIRTNY